MSTPSISSPARRGMRRFALSTALALSGAVFTLGGLGLSVAHAQASAPASCDMSGPDGCRHPGGPGGAGPREGHHPDMFGPFGHGRMLDRMLDDVKATDAQRTQIKQIADAARQDMQKLHEAGRGLHEKSMQVLTAPKVDEAAAESLRQQMLAQHDKVSKRALQAMLDISRVLTPEQRATLAQHMKDHMNERGSRGEHMGRMGHMGNMGQGPGAASSPRSSR